MKQWSLVGRAQGSDKRHGLYSQDRNNSRPKSLLKYRMYLLSQIWAKQLSPHIPTDGDFVYDKTAILRENVEGTLYKETFPSRAKKGYLLPEQNRSSANQL